MYLICSKAKSILKRLLLKKKGLILDFGSCNFTEYKALIVYELSNGNK